MDEHESTSERSSPPENLLAINQVAGPLMVELLTDLAAQGVRCRIVTGQVDAELPEKPLFEVLSARKLAKSPAIKRLWTWLRFTMQACWKILRHRRWNILVTTNPPWVMLAMPALKKIFGVRYALLMYDIYPDVLTRMGMLKKDGWLDRWWRRSSRRSMLAAEGVITLGEHMAETLRAHLADRHCPIEIIPNWADTDFIRPRPRGENAFAVEHGLTDKFVVMYSGAFGATHDTETIVAAAKQLQDLPDVHFVLIGGGTRQQQVKELVERSTLKNLTLLPFQPFVKLPLTLSVADCAIVCLDEGYEGVSVPSKTYYALAAAAALVAISPPNTELTDLLERYRCGRHVPPRRADLLAEAIRGMHADRSALRECQAASRKAAEEHFSRRAAVERYMSFLRAVFQSNNRSWV
jgi:glycosyltransferase involved in cell wall biosynthesis